MIWKSDWDVLPEFEKAKYRRRSQLAELCRRTNHAAHAATGHMLVEFVAVVGLAVSSPLAIQDADRITTNIVPADSPARPGIFPAAGTATPGIVPAASLATPGMFDIVPAYPQNVPGRKPCVDPFHSALVAYAADDKKQDEGIGGDDVKTVAVDPSVFYAMVIRLTKKSSFDPRAEAPVQFLLATGYGAPQSLNKHIGAIQHMFASSPKTCCSAEEDFTG